MNITTKTSLSNFEKQQVQALSEIVKKHDQTFSDPYLSNQFNFFAEMPTFFLAMSNQQIVGFMMLYADEAPQDDVWVDVTLFVHPNQRRKGIAQNLWQCGKKILVKYGYQHFNFTTEKNFLEQNPNFLTNTHLVINEAANEFQMMKNPDPSTFKLSPDLKVRLLKTTDLDAVIPMYCEAFPEATSSEAKQYLREGIKDLQTQNYLLEFQEKPAGLCAVDLADHHYYLFGLLIAKSKRNRGFGTKFLKELIRILFINQPQPLIIVVEENNQVAHHLYLKLGFKDQTQIYYLIPNKNS